MTAKVVTLAKIQQKPAQIIENQLPEHTQTPNASSSS
jgi:hypothetical protein